MAHLGSKTPIADRRIIVKNFRTDQNFRDIRHKCLKSKTLFEDDCFLEYLGSDKKWKRPHDIVSDPMFIDGKPNRLDIIQGDLKDSWLIASIEALTMHPIINHVVPPDQSFTPSHYTGAFHFKIFQLGIWYDVVVDDRLPCFRDDGSVCYAHSLSGKVFWGALLEKAYAKITPREGTASKRYMVDYNDLSFGTAVMALQDLTGGIVERFQTRAPPIFFKIDDLMKQIHARNDIMVLATTRTGEDAPVSKGLSPHHTYAVTKVYEVTPGANHGLRLVRIMNPTGTEDSKWRGDRSDHGAWIINWKQIDRGIREEMEFVIRDDGEFWMEVPNFLRRFENLIICHLEPTQFLDLRKVHRKYDKWHFAEAHGEWIKDINAVGPDLATRHLNPQVMFQIEKPEPDKESYQTCKTVIELSQPSTVGRIRSDLAFYIYHGLTCPLTHQNLLDLEPQDGYPDFDSCFVFEGCLKPGRFVVIPATAKPGCESNFNMRVFSPCPVKVVTRSRPIKKRSVIELGQALPLEEQSAIESNAIGLCKRMFIDTAQGSSEIDWIGLKDLLEEAFNPGGSIFERNLKFFNNIPANFEISSSHDKENGKVIFTKDECRSMIAMYDEDQTGKLNISEFCELGKQICFLTKIYDRYRDEVDGYLKVARFRDALDGMGYDVPTRTVHSLCYVYSDEQGIILLTDFILCGVTLEKTLSLVEKADIKDDGNIIFTLDEWVKKTLIL